MIKKMIIWAMSLFSVSFMGTLSAHDVIVIGCGAAGMTAAVAAKQNGAGDVLIIEKSEILGGHMLTANGTVMTLGPTSESPEQSKQILIREMMRRGEAGVRRDLVEKMVGMSPEVIRWLTELGVKWDEDFFMPYGAGLPWARSANRRHGGIHYVSVLSRALQQNGVEIVRKTKVTDVVRQGEEFQIVAENSTGRHVYTAKAVILATGGFTGNWTMLLQQRDDLYSALVSTATQRGSFADNADGSGIEIAQRLGARLVDMSYIDVTPLSGGRVTDYVGGDIYLNGTGERFINEGADEKVLIKKLSELPEKSMWVVTDRQSVKAANFEPKLLSGVIHRAESVQEMAQMMQVSVKVLQGTLDRYNQFVRAGKDLDFGKELLLQEINTPPYYFGQEGLNVHYVSGGVEIDSRSRVIGKSGAIEGLFAAGEVTGGIHGQSRMGGNALLDCFVYGYIAGTEAVKYVGKEKITQ